MLNRIKYIIKVTAAVLVIPMLAMIFAGCDNSSGPTATNLSEGSGYRIQVSVSDDTIPSGGSTIVTAAIFDETGQPAADDDDGVSFSFADKGGEWDGLTSGRAKLKNGVAAANLKWEDPSSGETVDPSRTAWISASYRGAVAKIQVSLVSNSF